MVGCLAIASAGSSLLDLFEDTLSIMCHCNDVGRVVVTRKLFCEREAELARSEIGYKRDLVLR
jgi:hypothetical protein